MVSVLYFKNKLTKEGRSLDVSENDFLELVISKTQNKETSDGFVLGKFSGSSRLNEDFIRTQYIALDFDSGNRLDEIQEKFQNYWHVIYTSLSHTSENQKFRLILRLKEPLERTDFQTKMKYLIQEFQADKSCSNPSRLWFGGKSIVAFNFSGGVYNITVPTPPFPKSNYHSQSSFKAGLSERSKRFLESGAPKGEWHKARLTFLMNAYHQGFTPDEVRAMFSKNHVLDQNDEFHIHDVYQRYFYKKAG